MKYLQEFLENETNLDANIFSQIKCSKKEIKILQYLTKEYINGVNEINVFELLTALFKKENYEYISEIKTIKELISYGWVNLDKLKYIRTNSIPSLEMLHADIS